MEKQYKVCQSCGMPLKKDAAGGGTNADGSISKKYCSHCYQKGNFQRTGITAPEMQTIVKEKIMSMGWVYRLLAGVFTKTIPQLERWQQADTDKP
jgi:hypothetical protein